jgi:tRNA(Ser,Leu) C12 N-acetylase TAN1
MEELIEVVRDEKRPIERACRVGKKSDGSQYTLQELDELIEALAKPTKKLMDQKTLAVRFAK